MVSKRDGRSLQKFLKQKGQLMDLALTELLIEELEFDRKIRRKAIRLSKRRKVGYIT